MGWLNLLIKQSPSWSLNSRRQHPESILNVFSILGTACSSLLKNFHFIFEREYTDSLLWIYCYCWVTTLTCPTTSGRISSPRAALTIMTLVTGAAQHKKGDVASGHLSIFDMNETRITKGNYTLFHIWKKLDTGLFWKVTMFCWV